MEAFCPTAQVIIPRVHSFKSGEVQLSLSADFKGVSSHKTAIVCQRLSGAIHDEILSFISCLELLKRENINVQKAFVPYLPYTRQDKKQPYHSCGFRVLATVFKAFGLKSILTIDKHNKIDSYDSLVFKSFFPLESFKQDIKKRFNLDQCLLIAPDEGAREKVQSLSQNLSVSYGVLKKLRQESSLSIELGKPLQLKGKTILLIDDLVDTGKTLMTARNLLKDLGAKDVHAYVTHWVPTTLEKGFVSAFESMTTTSTASNFLIPPKNLRILDIRLEIESQLKTFCN